MYGRVAEISLKEAMAYRVEFFSGMLGSMVQLAVFWFVWNAVYASVSAPIEGISLAAMLTYLSVSVCQRSLFYTEAEWTIENEIKTGGLAAILIKPISYPIYCLARQLGISVLVLPSQILPVLIIALVMIGISAPVAPLAFVVSIFLGYVISWCMVWLTGLWAFWSAGSIWGMRLARQMVADIMSGAIIPIYFFPGWLATIANILPFQAIFGTPLSIYIGKIAGAEIWTAIGIQVLWAAVFIGLSVFVWKRAQRKMFILGG